MAHIFISCRLCSRKWWVGANKQHQLSFVNLGLVTSSRELAQIFSSRYYAGTYFCAIELGT